jgi:hypothetical protein
MIAPQIDLRSRARWLGALSLAGAALAFYGCSEHSPPDESEVSANADQPGGTKFSDLPFVDAASNQQVVAELLAKPTALGETTALHVRLPPPRNQQLQSSLVRVIGQPESPQVLFSSDALAQLGVIKSSPGKDFFTAFSTLPPQEIQRLVDQQDKIASGAFGQATNETLLFAGRSPVARTINPKFDISVLQPGIPFTPLGCPFVPVSNQAAWDQSLFIRDPAIVQDVNRTWDPCTGIGTPGGVWTFAHLIREMANGSGRTPEQFALDWLSLWLNSYAPNSDTVAPRVAMFSQVIQPWATASGVTATLITNPTTGLRSVSLSGPLNLNIAPFRLLAIVNRIDLGETVHGGGGYGGSTTDLPVTAGELRFIFDVVQPNPWGAGGNENTCGKKLFTTIFEYGVPRTGCTSVVDWAQQWTSLLTFGGFTPAYRAQLQSMTESVVLHGKAPAKGNQNAINQVRTNEVALAGGTGIWELREFTLSVENPAAGTDTPANGPLRGHTVAQTPNDGAFSAAGGDATINAFVNGPVTAGVPAFVVNPNTCEADYNVPYIFSGRPFRGGNALIPPGHWEANTITAASGDRRICARHQFSFNTCQGCHRDDTANIGPVAPAFVNTSFTQIVPTDPPPVRESKFLTGFAPGMTWDVSDTQALPITNPPHKWPFADLDRRFRKLFTIAHCTSCFRIFPMLAQIIDIFVVVPIDIDPGDPPPQFKIGPVTDIATVQTLLDQRVKFAGALREEPAGFIRGADRSVH